MLIVTSCFHLITTRTKSSVNFRYMHNFDIPGTGINNYCYDYQVPIDPRETGTLSPATLSKEGYHETMHRVQQKLEDILEKQGVDVPEDLHGEHHARTLSRHSF